MDWRGVQSINATSGTLEAVLAKHSDLFRDELGTIRGIKAKLHVSPGAKPRFHRPRSIPYALRSRVDQALENLVSKGILEAVQLSEWAAPIVPVVKRDGSIRVCGDYKLTVNQVAQVDTYPLPLIQDIFASLANGKSFTKLNLETQISRFLFHYRITPHSTTGVPPAELLLGRRPRCRLDLLHPDISGRVRKKQVAQKEGHDGNCRERELSAGQLVWVKNHASGRPWLPGTIVRALTDQRYRISLEDGRVFDRHIDHVRNRVAKPDMDRPELLTEPVFHDPDLIQDHDDTDRGSPVDAADCGGAYTPTLYEGSSSSRTFYVTGVGV